MTTLPQTTQKKLGLAIDLDTCVGCHACVINCKEWNTSNYGAPLSDQDPYGAVPSGTFLNRIHTYEAKSTGCNSQTVHFPNPACIARTRPASPFAPRARLINGSKMASFW